MIEEETLEERIKYLETRIIELWSDADHYEEKATSLAEENEEFKKKNRKLERKIKELRRQIEILRGGICATLTGNYWRWYYAYGDELDDFDAWEVPHE
jgi:uncharacterized coiled-coil DUF342 family protein